MIEPTADDTSSSSAPPDPRLVRLIGVYDADSTLRGELGYWVGARLGRRHCSLCEITHGSVRAKPAWTACRAGLPVPFDTFHRNDQPEAVRAAAAGRCPVVVAEIDGSHAHTHTVLLTPEMLETCDGSIDALVVAVEHAVGALGLAWPTPSA